MRGLVNVLTVAALAAGLIGCAPAAPVAAVPQQGLQSPDVLAKVGWQYYWTLPRAPFMESGETISRLYMLGDVVAYLTSRNRLVACDATTGLVRWSVKVAPEGETVYDPCFVKGMVLHKEMPGLKTLVDPDTAPWGDPFDAVVVNTVAYLFVVDATTGRIVRAPQMSRFGDMPPATSGAIDTKRFYGATAQGTCFAYELDAGMRSWVFGGYSGVTAPVRECGGIVFMGNKAGELYAAKADKDRTLLWEQTIREPIIAPFYAGKRGIFVAGERGSIYAFHSIGGHNLWVQPFVCEGRLADPIQVSSRTVFQYAQGDKFYALGITDGKARWTLPEGRLVLATIGDDAFVLDHRKVLHALDEVTGKAKWTVPLTGLDVFLSNTSADGIWAASRDGRLFCLRPISAGRLTLEQLGLTNN